MYFPSLRGDQQDAAASHRNSASGRVNMQDYEVECMGTIKLKFQKLRSQAIATPDQKVETSFPQYASHLIQSLYQHQQDGSFCDFILKLESGHEVPIHKLVLSSTSNYFNCLFQSQMLEMQQGFVELKGMNEEAILKLVKFMYTGKLSLSKDNIVDMVDTASHLQVERALALCSDYLISTMSKGNCVVVYNLADKYSLEKVKSCALRLMWMTFTQLPEEQLLMLSENQMISLVESDALLCSSEFDVFLKVEKWLNNIEDGMKRLRLTETLMRLVRFPLMSGDDLVSKVSKVDLMQNEICNKILTEAKDYHIVTSSQPVLQSCRTQVRSLDIIYMAMFHPQSGFSVYPLFSPNYRLFSQDPVELRKPPRGIISPTLCVYNNFLFACGGVYDRADSAISTARCFRYDPRNDSWLEIASMNEARQRFNLEVVGDYMFALGGWDESDQSNTYEVYNFATNEWKQFYLPTGYHNPSKHATVAYGHSIYVSGGSISKLMSQLIHDEKTPGILTFRQLPPMCVGRKKHIMFAHNNKIFVLGGLSTSIEVFDVVTEQWTLYEGFAEMLSPLRLAGVCSLLPTRIVLVSYRESRASCLLLNLEKDPDKEKSLFLKKLPVAPKLEAGIKTCGIQIWMPVINTVVKKKETSSVE